MTRAGPRLLSPLHTGHLSSPQAGNPPPLREVLRVAEQAEGWGLPEWE
jgi:hypothetical protein